MFTIKFFSFSVDAVAELSGDIVSCFDRDPVFDQSLRQFWWDRIQYHLYDQVFIGKDVTDVAVLCEVFWEVFLSDFIIIAAVKK